MTVGVGGDDTEGGESVSVAATPSAYANFAVRRDFAQAVEAYGLWSQQRPRTVWSCCTARSTC
jgi:hypothetical protein